eukprot:SAG31_NODE_30947_length_374_cov_0.912727_1_plen_53_part_01
MRSELEAAAAAPSQAQAVTPEMSDEEYLRAVGLGDKASLLPHLTELGSGSRPH